MTEQQQAAIRQAIADLEDASDMAFSEFSVENLYGETIAALRQALANEALDKKAENARELGLDYEPKQQPADEPVAWIEHEWSGTGTRRLHFERSEPTVRDEVVNPVWTPLYTRPQPAAWVGLTDEEMHACWDSPLTPLGMKHARMIEAKLKEKNT